MKKYLFMGLMAFAGASTLTSCSQEEETALASVPSHLRVRATIGGMESMTRSMKTGTAFDDGDQLGLYVTNTEGSALYNATSGNVKATKSGTGWTLAATIPLSSTSAKVYAYFPHASGQKSSVDGIQSVAIAPGETDYMWGVSQEVNASNPTAEIKMKHALSCLVFKFTNQGSPNACVLSGSVLDNASASVFYSGGTMNIGTGAVTVGTAAKQTYTEDANFSAAAATVEHMIVPNGKDIAAGDCKFIFTIDGKTYTYDVASLKDGYKPGYKYTYSFVMKGSNLALDEDDPSGNGGITITPWEDGGNAGSMTFE